MITKDNISKLTIGTVVQHIDTSMIGHIVGFGQNCFKEILVEVKWADFTQYALHPAILTFEVRYDEYIERWCQR